MEKNEAKEMPQKNNSKEKKTISEKVKEAADKVKETVTKDKKIEVSQKEYEELKAQLEEAKTDFLRSRADFENFRKRSQEELIQARDKAINSFVVDLLPSIDNFEMSLKMTDNKDMFIKGVEMIHGNLLNILKEHHFEEFEPKIGDEFDANKHEPILIEAPDKENGKVLAVLQKGYIKKDNMIRPAKVHIKKIEEN